MRSRTVQPLKRRNQRAGTEQGSSRYSGQGMRAHGAPESRRAEQRRGHGTPDGNRGRYNAYYAAPDIGIYEDEWEDEEDNRKKRGILSSIFVTDAQYFDYDLLLVIIFLMCFGLVMLYSTSSYSYGVFYFAKQAVIGAGSFAVLLFVSKIDYHLYGAFSFEIYLFALFLMALVQTPLGVTVKGARRWIGITESLTFQPAEVMKIAVILFISYELCRLGNKARNFKEGGIRIFAFGLAAAGGVRILTDNLSTAIIVMAITCILYFVVHPKLKPFLAMLAGAGVLIFALVRYLSTTLADSENFRFRRIITWLDPEGNTDTGGFQVMQGLYAIGSGGFFGKGLGNSTQKLGVIPEAQNDMILTIVCEELGVFGAIIILVLFGFLLYRLIFIARNAPDLYGALVATGIFAHISLQVILNAMVVTNLIPTTGITLPFISYGGTSILFLMTEMGIALGISRKIKLKEG